MRFSPFSLISIAMAFTACEDPKCCHPEPVPVDKATTGDTSSTTSPIDDEACIVKPVPADKP